MEEAAVAAIVGILGVIIAGIITHYMQASSRQASSRNEKIYIFPPSGPISLGVAQQPETPMSASQQTPPLKPAQSTSLPPSQPSTKAKLPAEVVTDDELLAVVADLKIAEREGDTIEVFIRRPPP